MSQHHITQPYKHVLPNTEILIFKSNITEIFSNIFFLIFDYVILKKDQEEFSKIYILVFDQKVSETYLGQIR